MLSVTLGSNGCKNSWQEEFPKTTKCVHCGGVARVGFVLFEYPDKDVKDDMFICELHKNSKKGAWLHDCCAVAVYFCRECLETTSLYNQG